MTGVIRRTVSSATATSSGFNHGGLSSSSSSACPSTRGAMSTNKVLCTTTTTSNLLSGGKEIHKKLDRSFSEPAEKKNNAMAAAAAAAAAASSTNLAPSSRYKTELCRSFAEIGTCKYGDKCQFAHGEDELRTITRHPKFKTENCKSFHSTGFCPYGPRCHFIHNDESKRAANHPTSSTTPASGSTGTLSSHHHHQQQQQPQARQFESALAAKQSSNAGAGNFATAMSEMSHHHHHLYSHPPPRLPFMTSSPTAVASIVGTTVVRPKALSLGSYSLGSSGEISLPSSQSGSPTSLNSFFNDENAAFGFGTSALRMGSSAVSGANAFSFSPDSAFISFTQAHSPPSSAGLAFASNNATSNNLASKDMFGVSEPMNIDETTTNSLISSLFCPNGDAAFGEASSINDYLFRSMSPPASNNMSHPMLYPSSPESPVDSVASEIEALKLGEPQPSTFSPISSSSVFSSSSLSVSSGSPSNGLTDAFSSFQTSNISRLPTFTKFAATATIN